MNALEALQEALNSGGNLIARPCAWSGSGWGITWSASDGKSPFAWREGWILLPRKGKCGGKYKLSPAELPEPEHLFDEWEVIDFPTFRLELKREDRPDSRIPHLAWVSTPPRVGQYRR